MKDIFAALWTRFKPSPFAIVSILYLVCCVVNGVINASLYHRLTVATSLADSQADTIATLVGQRDAYQMQIDYHVDNTPPQADVLPIQRMPVVATNSYTVPAPHVSGIRKQAKHRKHRQPFIFPRIVSARMVPPFTASMTSGVGGTWTCEVSSAGFDTQDCNFEPSVDGTILHTKGELESPTVIVTGDPPIKLIVDERTLQTTGPMPVKACDLEHCEVVNGTWTLNPATTSDGSH